MNIATECGDVSLVMSALAQMCVDEKRLTGSLGLLLNSHDFEKKDEKKEKCQNVTACDTIIDKCSIFPTGYIFQCSMTSIYCLYNQERETLSWHQDSYWQMNELTGNFSLGVGGTQTCWGHFHESCSWNQHQEVLA